jgi:dolichol-phosphate mannosyltransferase
MREDQAKDGSGCANATFSIVIPLNNEEQNVEPLLDELRRAVTSLPRCEVIIVDDGSCDGTARAVRRCTFPDAALRLLRHERRRGQSTAVYNGVLAARTEIVVVLDGDLQNDPADIPVLLDRLASDADPATLGLVIGHRRLRRDSALRKVSSRLANLVRARVLGDATPDTGCGLKLVRRSVFVRLPYFDHMHRFLPALVLRAGFRVVTVPVSHRPRLHGAAHYGTLDRLWVGLVDLAGVAWLAHRARPTDFEEERL